MREWDGEAFRVTRHKTITPRKAELEQAFDAYGHWVAQQMTIPRDVDEGEVVA